jgi:hypothetical protein
MSKQRIDEGVMKYLVKMFFPFLEKKFLKDPEVQASLRKMSKHAAAVNQSIQELEKLTGKDLKHMYLKHK